jgi:hypothetical protein
MYYVYTCRFNAPKDAYLITTFELEIEKILDVKYELADSIKKQRDITFG